MSFVAIDGPGGAGKSTVARALAARLGWERLDTGAMYRALTLAALRAGIDLADGEALAERARSMELVVDESVLLDGEDVSAAIRTPEVSAAVSEVSAHLAVRAELVSRQRAWASQRSAGVMEGRDIGSVVLPDALLKVYLTADPEVRAARRGAEHGPDERGVHRAAAALAARDRHDSNRGASPLTVAEGAMVVDSSGLQPEDVVDHLLAALAERGVTIDQAARTYAVPSPELVETESAEREPAARTGGEPAEVVAPPAGESRLPRGRAQGVASEPPAVRPISSGELAFYAVCRFISVGASRIYLPGPVIGAERLPKDAPFILAPTHRSYVDWLVAARVSKRRLRYLVKGEVWKSSFTGRLLELLGAFPVHRGTADRVAFNRSLEVLAAGEPLVIFPEGTRQSGTEVGPLQEGAAYLALRAGVPVIPLGLGGTERSMPRGARFPHPVRVRVIVGEPLLASSVLGSEASLPSGRISRAATRAFSEALREALQKVLDEAEGRVPAADRAR